MKNDLQDLIDLHRGIHKLRFLSIDMIQRALNLHRSLSARHKREAENFFTASDNEGYLFIWDQRQPIMFT